MTDRLISTDTASKLCGLSKNQLSHKLHAAMKVPVHTPSGNVTTKCFYRESEVLRLMKEKR